MDIYQMMLSAASALLGAGSVYGTLQTKVKQNAKDIEDVKKATSERFDHVDQKLDQIFNYLLTNKK